MPIRSARQPRVPGPLAAAALLTASAAHAGPFVGVNVDADPDTLVAFDTANPAAANPAAPLATLSGNFVRGFDLDTPTTGYYVATASFTGGPTGFFRYNTGVSSLIAPLPFNSTSLGGLTLTRDADALYWVSQPLTGDDDTLYHVTLAGTFTRVGVVRITGQLAVTITGLAVHPRTGDLYGIDAVSASLISIDPQTAAATRIGTLGVTVSGVGGLDFDNATSELFYAGGTPPRLFRVDLQTGAATLIGNLPFAAGSLASRAPRPVRCASDINADWRIDTADITAFLAAWFDARAGGEPEPADFNDDGEVNTADITAFLSQWFADRSSGGC